MTLTHYGLREWGTALIVAIVFCAAGWFLGCRQNHPGWGAAAAAIGILFFACVAFFFRNPHRNIPAGELTLTSPADGVVRDITEVDDFNFQPFNGKAKRIGIFLSVFNVHVNRAPGAMTVETKHYREGEYLDARNAEAAKRNEAMTIAGTMKLSGGKVIPVAVRQISGAIARRIVCPAEPGQKLEKGEIYGMIKFGSRTELYLPVDGVRIAVKVGEPVRGGETILAELAGSEEK